MQGDIRRYIKIVSRFNVFVSYECYIEGYMYVI